jgi:hypothetical protein
MGVQVTEYCADEGIANPGRGVRATEKHNARQGQFPPAAIPLQHQLTSLRERVRDKIEKAYRYTFHQFDEVHRVHISRLPPSDAGRPEQLS